MTESEAIWNSTLAQLPRNWNDYYDDGDEMARVGRLFPQVTTQQLADLNVMTTRDYQPTIESIEREPLARSLVRAAHAQYELEVRKRLHAQYNDVVTARNLETGPEAEIDRIATLWLEGAYKEHFARLSKVQQEILLEHYFKI